MASNSTTPRTGLKELLLSEVPRLIVRNDMRGAACTTYAIGGQFEAFADVPDLETLTQLVKVLAREGLPRRMLGAGSNLLLSSEGISGLTLRLGRGFRYSESQGAAGVRVGAATSLMTLSREVSERGLSGLEFAGGIPASLGGAVVMNAGAHGGQLSDMLQSVVVVLPDGSIQTIHSKDLDLSYRHSLLPKGAIVTELLLKLTPGDPVVISERRRHFLAERKARQPLQSPSGGSVFRNPSPDNSAGKVIEQSGLKGRMYGGAAISELHANWIINESRTASDRDIKALISLCQSTVKERLGINLKPELVMWDQ